MILKELMMNLKNKKVVVFGAGEGAKGFLTYCLSVFHTLGA